MYVHFIPKIVSLNIPLKKWFQKTTFHVKTIRQHLRIFHHYCIYLLTQWYKNQCQIRFYDPHFSCIQENSQNKTVKTWFGCKHVIIEPLSYTIQARMYSVERNIANQVLLLPLEISFQSISCWYMISKWLIPLYSNLIFRFFQQFGNNVFSSHVQKQFLYNML